MARLSRSAVDGLGTLVRLGLAAVFLVSGALKAVDPAQTRIAVRAYELLPPDLVGPVATALPLVELVLGTLLLVGAITRWVALASGVLLVVLMTAVAQAWARGLSIDCGCFGGGGAVAKGDTRYPQELARDVGTLLLALWLVVRPRTVLSVDRWLRADPGTADPGAADPPDAPWRTAGNPVK
ncbi:MAG: DoxX family membrane protein [Actinomycetota bacterium]|nr:DoxX family membrane protein [Actinomycetota bacterium]